MSEMAPQTGWDTLRSESHPELMVRATNRLTEAITQAFVDYNEKVNFVDTTFRPGFDGNEDVQIQQLPFMPVMLEQAPSGDLMWMLRIDAYRMPGGDTRTLSFDVIGALTTVPIDYFTDSKNEDRRVDISRLNLRTGAFGRVVNDKQPYRDAMFNEKTIATVRLARTPEGYQALGPLVYEEPATEGGEYRALERNELEDMIVLVERYGDIVASGMEKLGYKLRKMAGDFMHFNGIKHELGLTDLSAS